MIHGCARLQAWAPCGCAATCGMLCVPDAAHSQRGAFTALFPTGCIPNAVHSQRRAFIPSTRPPMDRLELQDAALCCAPTALGCRSLPGAVTALLSPGTALHGVPERSVLHCCGWRSGILLASSCSGLETRRCGSVGSRGSCACRAVRQGCRKSTAVRAVSVWPQQPCVPAEMGL